MKDIETVILNGELYDANNEEFFKRPQKCKKLCFEFNNISPDKLKKEIKY